MISVCIASYNGEKFIKKQIESILCQLDKDDELIVSDDSSVDNTIAIIKNFHDSRIKILHANFKSPVMNFENAIKHASGDYIFLSDQDDEWMPQRIAVAKKKHDNEFDLVYVNRVNVYKDCQVIAKTVNPFEKSFLANLVKPKFIGCCFSFSRKVADYVLPFPKGIAMHDLWIGLIAQKKFKCGYIAEPLIRYNRHEESYIAKHRISTINRLRYRLHMLFNVYKRILFK